MCGWSASPTVDFTIFTTTLQATDYDVACLLFADILTRRVLDLLLDKLLRRRKEKKTMYRVWLWTAER
jgi:hypothetical protein